MTMTPEKAKLVVATTIDELRGLPIDELAHRKEAFTFLVANIDETKCRCDESDPRVAHISVCYKCGKEWDGGKTIHRVREVRNDG